MFLAISFLKWSILSFFALLLLASLICLLVLLSHTFRRQNPIRAIHPESIEVGSHSEVKAIPSARQKAGIKKSANSDQKSSQRKGRSKVEYSLKEKL